MIFVGKPEGKRPLGNPCVNGKMILKEVLKERGCEGMDWINLAQVTDNWRALVKTAINNIKDRLYSH
jgi:hypothetical protein